MGMATFEGIAAVREFLEDWWGGYDEFRAEPEEMVDFGNGVLFGIFVQKGRPVGSSGEVGVRYAAMSIWVEGLIVRMTHYTDIDEARAAAERLAEERG